YRIAQGVADKLEPSHSIVAHDGENGGEGSLQAVFYALGRWSIRLKKGFEGFQLSRQKVRDVLHVGSFGEALAYALLFGVRIRHEHSDSRGYNGRQPRPWFTTPENPAPSSDCLPGLPRRNRTQVFWRRKSPGRPLGFPGKAQEVLLEFDLGASFFQLLLSFFSTSLVQTFLDRLRSAVNQILRFLQAQASDFANGL